MRFERIVVVKLDGLKTLFSTLALFVSIAFPVFLENLLTKLVARRTRLQGAVALLGALSGVENPAAKIDAAVDKVLAAVESSGAGKPQIVLLGAGFDTRAMRYAERIRDIDGDI